MPLKGIDELHVVDADVRRRTQHGTTLAPFDLIPVWCGPSIMSYGRRCVGRWNVSFPAGDPVPGLSRLQSPSISERRGVFDVPEE